MLCNLVPIALSVGAPRIVPTRGIQFPTGDPSLTPAEEHSWRRRLMETALVAVSTAVSAPTVFDPADLGAAAGARPA